MKFEQLHLSICFFFISNIDITSLLCSFIANTVRGPGLAVVSTEGVGWGGWLGQDNAQTVTAEWIVLTHLIDVAFNRYHIHTAMMCANGQHELVMWPRVFIL